MEKVRRHEFEIDGMSSTRQKSPGPVVETPMDIQKTEPQPQKLVLNKSKSRVAEKAVQVVLIVLSSLVSFRMPCLKLTAEIILF